MTTQEQVALNPDLIGAKWYVEGDTSSHTAFTPMVPQFP